MLLAKNYKKKIKKCNKYSFLIILSYGIVIKQHLSPYSGKLL